MRRRSQRQLTRRETQVIVLVMQGLTDKAIAGDLGLGVGTVRNHMASILRRLDAVSRAQAVAKFCGR